MHRNTRRAAWSGLGLGLGLVALASCGDSRATRTDGEVLPASASRSASPSASPSEATDLAASSASSGEGASSRWVRPEPEPCEPIPDELLGSWGTADGIEVRCGGIAGRCSARRTVRKTLFRLRAPSFVQEGSGPLEVLCLTTHPTRTGTMRYRFDIWGYETVSVSADRDMMSRSRGIDSLDVSYYRLDRPPPDTVPTWAVGDFELDGGPAILRTGENGRWVIFMTARERPGMGKIGAATADDPRCIGLEDNPQIGGIEGDLCLAGPGEPLRFRMTNPIIAPATVVARRIVVDDAR